jgi:uncharacterized NAD(P)/FAD-binding protein YdhS
MITVAVLGLGASGTIVADRLAGGILRAGLAGEVRVELYDGTTSAVRGKAYRTPYAFHLNNLRTVLMSVLSEQPAHYADWAVRNGMLAEGPDYELGYLPRWTFGRYLAEHLAETRAKAASAGLDVALRAEEVVAVHRDGPGYRLTTAAGGRRHADYVVLCPGEPASVNFPEFGGRPGYIADPWDFGALEAIPKDDPVTIAGTSLTAVDMALLLDHLGHRGPVRCVARRRLLPRSQSAFFTHEPRHLTEPALRELTGGYTRPVRLADVVERVRRELTDVLGDSLPWDELRHPRADGVPAALAEDAASEHGDVGRACRVLASLTEIIPHWWRRLDDDDKAEFLRDFHGVWSMYKHAMPVDNGRRMLALVRTGRVRVHNNLAGIHRHGGGFRCRLTGPRRDIDAPWLIDASGLPRDLTRLTSPLLRQLRETGLITQHPHGGVDVDFDTLAVRAPDRTVSGRLFLVGPLTLGVHFHTQAIDAIRKYAEHATTALLGSLHRPRKDEHDDRKHDHLGEVRYADR